MKVDWYRCKGEIWCDLFKVDLTHKYLDTLSGVYIIWYGDTTPTVLRVGSGIIKNELLKAKKDIAMMAFTSKGLYVTWAEVSSLKRTSLELFLINKLNPKLPVTIPKAIAIKVNTPWETDYDEE